MEIKFDNGSIIDCISSQNNNRSSRSKLLTIKVKHICPHGHEFYPVMKLNHNGELVYYDWNNNLCTVDNCDSIGWIE